MSRNSMTTIERIAIQPLEGESVDFGSLGVVWKIEGAESEGRFSVVEHPIPPRTLAAALHFHHNEDEYSYVLEGSLGAQLGDTVAEAQPGSWVFKPRGEWHAFWNAGDTPCRIIEVISPAGFESRVSGGLCSTPCRRPFVSFRVVPCRCVWSGAAGVRSDALFVTFRVVPCRCVRLQSGCRLATGGRLLGFQALPVPEPQCAPDPKR